MSKIFMFGNTGVGKSTICAGIVHYFFNAKGFAPHWDPGKNADGANMLHNWLELLEDKKFPPKTELDTIQEVRVGYTTSDGKKLGLTFLEVSGEAVKSFDPMEPGFNERKLEIEEFIKECDKVIPIGSVDPADKRDKYRLYNFLYFLKDIAIRPVLLVISEWDKETEGKSVLEFAKKNYREVAANIANDEYRFPHADIISFSIGTVNQNNGDKIQQINSLMGAKQIVEWIEKSSLPQEN